MLGFISNNVILYRKLITRFNPVTKPLNVAYTTCISSSESDGKSKKANMLIKGSNVLQLGEGGKVTNWTNPNKEPFSKFYFYFKIYQNGELCFLSRDKEMTNSMGEPQDDATPFIHPTRAHPKTFSLPPFALR